MFSIFVVTLREGIEAFLIVAITLAYLRQTGRHALTPVVYASALSALLLSGAAGQWFAAQANQPLWEGALAFVAAALVISMVIYMHKAARFLKQNIHRGIDAALTRAGWTAKAGVFLFVLFMMLREGMEMALILGSLSGQVSTRPLFAGALMGVLASLLLAWAWARYGKRIDLGRFFKVTSIFLALFAAQLLVYGVHEFTEANVLPIDNHYWHEVTEAWTPEGPYALYFSLALIGLPLAWLAWDAGRKAGPGAPA